MEEGRAVDTNPRNGQAFVELIIGIVAIVIIFVGGIQYFYASNAHRGLTTTIRGEVGELALSGSSSNSTPSYILTWDDGKDNIRHTDDDTPITESSITLSTIADGSVSNSVDWDLLNPLKRENPMRRMHEPHTPDTPTTALGFVNVGRSDTITVDPAFQTFVLSSTQQDLANITVRHTVWMPLLGGLY
jgi:hypothetical protein